MVKSEPIRETPDGIEVNLLVVPNASRAAIVGLHGDRIKVKVTSPPARNQANAAVVALLKAATGARRATVTRGGTARHKSVLLTGVSYVIVVESLIDGVLWNQNRS